MWIKPDAAPAPFQVACYLQWGGWTYIQRREINLGPLCGSRESFYRNWNDYQTGFGQVGCDFWLGNDHIHYITSGKRYQLDVIARSNPPTGFDTYHSRYNDFRVGDESTDYTLTVGMYDPNNGYTSPIGDSLTPAGDPNVHANASKFSTLDRDNDQYAGGNCAVNYQSGWWFKNCTASNVNGVYSWQPTGIRDTSVPSMWWKYDIDTVSIVLFDLKLLALP